MDNYGAIFNYTALHLAYHYSPQHHPRITVRGKPVMLAMFNMSAVWQQRTSVMPHYQGQGHARSWGLWGHWGGQEYQEMERSQVFLIKLQKDLR